MTLKPNALTIRVLYTCRACGLADIGVDVPARELEDVTDWLKTTAQLCGDDHCSRNPACSHLFVDVKIPVSGADRVGGATVQ